MFLVIQKKKEGLNIKLFKLSLPLILYIEYFFMVYLYWTSSVLH